jgi:hypothetical protein
MARRVFSEFDDELEVRLANRTDITSAMRAFLLNDAMFKIGKHYVHTQLQKVDDATQLITTDSFTLDDGDLWWVEHIRNTTDNRPLSLGDMDKIEAIAKRTAPPQQYYTRGSTIYTDTISNTAKTHKVFYVKKPAQWSSGEAPYDEDFDMLIIMWAHKLGHETVRDFEAADAVGKQIGMYVSGMKFPIWKQQMNDINSRLTVRHR